MSIITYNIRFYIEGKTSSEWLYCNRFDTLEEAKAEAKEKASKPISVYTRYRVVEVRKMLLNGKVCGVSVRKVRCVIVPKTARQWNPM